MDNPVIVVVVVIVAVIIGAMFLSRGVRRSVSAAGGRYGRRTAQERVNAILDELGTALVIRAPEPVAREIVDRVTLQHPRRFTALADGGYGIRFIEADDAVVRLVDDAEGTRMRVERSVERLGMPQNLESWQELRTLVSAAAAAQEIAVTVAPRRGFTRHAREPAHWTLADTP